MPGILTLQAAFALITVLRCWRPVLENAGHQVRILDFGTVEIMRRLYPEEISRKTAPLLAELQALKGPPPQALVDQLAAADALLEAHQAVETEALAGEIAECVADLAPAFVGFKLWNGDGTRGSVTIAEAIRRRNPRLKIYAGGPNATWFGSVLYRKTDVFDALIVGRARTRYFR